MEFVCFDCYLSYKGLFFFFVSGLLLIFKINTCIDESMFTGISPRDCHLPSNSRATCSGELEKVQEKGDHGMTRVARRYSCV